MNKNLWKYNGPTKGKKAVSYGRGYDFEEFQESMRKLWNNYLLLETEERKALVTMAKRF